jgi:hypothetical protein
MKFFILVPKTTFLGLITIMISSCNQSIKTENINAKKNNTPEIVIQKVTTKITNDDTLIIENTSAVIVSADSLQMEKRKKELGKDFYAGADDYAFYLNETQKFLDSVKLKTIDCNGKKYLKFVYTDRSIELINLTNLDELWKVYFFSPSKKSVSVDMTMIDEEYKKYFN